MAEDQQPTAKRARTMAAAPVAGDGGGEASPPGSPKLRPTYLVVLFAVRMIMMNPVPAAPSISEIGATVQRIVDMVSSCQSKVEKAFQTLQAMQGQIDSIQHDVRQMAHQVSNRRAEQHTRPQSNEEHGADDGSNTNIRLCFLNDLKPPIYTGKNIRDKDNASIKLAIFEGDKIITSGPLSKIKIEIVVLRGEFYENGRDDWTEEEFDSHVVQGQDEQGLLGTVRLINGEVELSQIRFKKGTCRKNIIMAARVCKAENTAHRVQEAIMKPVVVMDGRNEANEKRYPPRLDDEVFRLEKIARNGDYSRRLREAKICKVQEFLKALNKDPNKLRETLQMGTKNNSWSKLTEHAKQCVLDIPELKSYQSEDGSVVLFFDCVDDVVGADFGGGYIASRNFKADDKALVDRWKGRAYDELEGIASDYVMKGNVPEKIPLSTSAAGPSVLARGASQPFFSADHLAVSQAENSPHGVNNHITPTIFANANIVGEGSSLPSYLNMNDYQDQETAPPNQHPTILDSIMPDWQNVVALTDPLAFEDMISNIDRFQVPVPGPGEFACLGTMGAPQPLSAEHGEGPSCSAFPEYGPSNSC